MRFNLVRPCDNCPFRKDVRPFLLFRRAQMLVRQFFKEERLFACHKTVSYPDEEDHGPWPEESQCAGAAIMSIKSNQSHWLLRLAAGEGLFDPARLNMSSPVYESQEALLQAYKDEECRGI